MNATPNLMNPIPRDEQGLARTKFSRERPDGGLDLVFGLGRYELSSRDIADGVAFGRTLLRLREKRWFTDAMQSDLTNVVTARWIAKKDGWI